MFEFLLRFVVSPFGALITLSILLLFTLVLGVWRCASHLAAIRAALDTRDNIHVDMGDVNVGTGNSPD